MELSEEEEGDEVSISPSIVVSSVAVLLEGAGKVWSGNENRNKRTSESCSQNAWDGT